MRSGLGRVKLSASISSLLRTHQHKASSKLGASTVYFIFVFTTAPQPLELAGYGYA